MQVDSVVSSPLRRAKDTATPIAELQTLAGNSAPPISTQEGLVDRFWGSFEGRLVQEVRCCSSLSPCFPECRLESCKK